MPREKYHIKKHDKKVSKNVTARGFQQKQKNKNKNKNKRRPGPILGLVLTVFCYNKMYIPLIAYRDNKKESENSVHRCDTTARDYKGVPGGSRRVVALPGYMPQLGHS